MRVIFTGDPIELEGMAKGQGLSRSSTTVYGVTFPMSAEVDVSHLSEVQKRKLLNNPHFRPAGIDAPAAPLILPVSVAAPVAAQASDDLAEEQAEAAAHADRVAKKAANKASKG